MSSIVKIKNLEEFIIEIKGQNVLLDSDVAPIYVALRLEISIKRL